MKYKCIIFDCDGVLVDSEPISNRILVTMIKSNGFEIDLNYVATNYEGKSMKAIIDDLTLKFGKPLPLDFEKEFRQKTFDAFRAELKPISGIQGLLDQLTIPFCVASNGPLKKIELNLATVSLFDQFKGNIFSAYEIAKWKPHPDLYLHAAKKMGFRVEECAVVEDSQSGINAAIAGGFDTYAFTNGINRFQIFGENITVFSDMNQLFDLWNIR